jgi:hypothetical protein
MSEQRQSSDAGALWPLRELPEGVSPDDSPFDAPEVEGIPFPRGSKQPEAVRRFIERAERRRAERAPREGRGQEGLSSTSPNP